MRPSDEPFLRRGSRRAFWSALFATIGAGGIVATQQLRPEPDRVDVPADAQAQTAAATSQLMTYLNDVAHWQLARRAATIAAIRTREDAERRQLAVRAKILDLVGGAVTTGGPVNVRPFATVADEGFRIENIAYESAPGYWVTANVYVPAGPGPFPAIVIAPGHGAGKSSQYAWGAYFAQAGVLTLSFDPMGQGERMQHFDPELGTSRVEPNGEHEHANQTALLIGDHVARYWFADGMRGVDYLTARADVDPGRIGTFGCSGGGTAATYLAAMDSRIRVAAVASFITAFRDLLPGNGRQDAEQTLPSFIASELDIADWVGLAAPRPFAIVAFEDDFLPVAGARETYEEARRFYAHFGAENDLRYIGGPGGHCDLGPVTQELVGFLFTHLVRPGSPVPPFTQARPKDPRALIVTPTGQVSTSLSARSVEDLTRERATTRLPPVATPPSMSEDIIRHRERVQEGVRLLAGIVASPGMEGPQGGATFRQQFDGYRVEDVTLQSEPGITLTGVIGTPDEAGPKPAVIWMDAAPHERTIATPEFVRLVQSGHTVFAFHPRGVLGEPPATPTRLALGPYMPLLLRAIVVGRTLVGMRADDVVRAVDWLMTRPDVDRGSVVLYGAGAQGMVALHAAVLDRRITAVIAENTLVSYRAALDAHRHRNLSEVLIPGVLTRYDVPDLLQAIGPRQVWLVNPADPMGQPLHETLAREALDAAFEADRAIRATGRIQLVRRTGRDPLPIP